MNERGTVLVHLAAGIGNIVLATPLLMVLARNGFTIDLVLDADYLGVEQLFHRWTVVRQVYAGFGDAPVTNSYGHIIPAIPPFYWRRFKRRYAGIDARRPADALFYENEQAYYLEFARFLGCDVSNAPYYSLPAQCGTRKATVVVAPGSKPAEMSAKRWRFFAELTAQLNDVTVVGTEDDLTRFDGSRLDLPDHVRSLVGQLSLRETASLLGSAAAVVANDSGLGHLAGALGTPVVLLFGPTPHRTLGPLPPNVKVLVANLPCEPCWFGARFRACNRRIDCLADLTVTAVMNELEAFRRTAQAAVL